MQHALHASGALGLATDLYELTMAQAYHAEGFEEAAVFDVHMRTLPPRWNHLVASGLPDVLDAIASFRFNGDDVAYLSGLGLFTDDFLDRLRDFRFTGTVHAMPEGTPFFPHEPVLRVEAPLVEAQVLETLALNQAHAGILLASKAARVVEAARGAGVVDFGFRRAHGLDAGLKAARGAWLAGADGTSNVLAGRAFGIPVRGTMAHSYVQAHSSELAAFRAWTRTFPDTILLVDTTDTREGVENVVRLARELGADFRVRGVRIDSGDLDELARHARARLDEAGLTGVQVVVSGGLDEYGIARLVDAGAPVDAFGVGTAMTVSADAPFLDLVYKLAEYAGEPRLKKSAGKATLPGVKQVYRERDAGGIARRDVLALADEEGVPGEPLLETVMEGGRAKPLPALADARARCLRERDRLPPEARGIVPVEAPYRVDVSPGLEALTTRVRERV